MDQQPSEPVTYQNPGDFRRAAVVQGSSVQGSQLAGTINNYSGVVPTAVREDELRAAGALFDRLPVDAVPDPPLRMAPSIGTPPAAAARNDGD